MVTALIVLILALLVSSSTSASLSSGANFERDSRKDVDDYNEYNYDSDESVPCPEAEELFINNESVEDVPDHKPVNLRFLKNQQAWRRNY